MRLSPEVAAVAREHLGAGRVLRACAQGHSMWPLLRAGEIVSILPLTASAPLCVGDVVLFEAPVGLVLHRVVRVTADAVITKGDARPKPDGRVARDDVLGRLARRPWDPLAARVSGLGGASLAQVVGRARRVSDALSRAFSGAR